MTNNEKYLEKCKIERSTYMTNAENSIDSGNSVAYEEMKIEIKKAHALEIIAETLIKIDSKMDDMMTSDGRLKVVDIFHG